jgi:serine/threonine protein kinase
MEFDRRDTHEEDRDVHPTNQDLHVIPSPKINGNHVGAPRQPAPDLSELEDIIPVNVGRLRLYEVGKQIGSGKFSVVFRARMADGRNVALKKIQIFNIMDAKSRNKCLREVHMLQSISQHENLIEYLDAINPCWHRHPGPENSLPRHRLNLRCIPEYRFVCTLVG